MPTYRIIRCPHCGQVQVTSALVLKCKYCNKSTTLKGADGHVRAVILGETADNSEAARMVQAVNEQKVG
jgi:transcription elongation factor Elf1